MLLPGLAMLAEDAPAEATDMKAQFNPDGLPSDAHFAALAAAPAATMRHTRGHALLLALQHASASDLDRREGGTGALFSAIAALSPGDAFEAHLRALADAASKAGSALIFLSEIFGPHVTDSGAAAAQVSLVEPSCSCVQKSILGPVRCMRRVTYPAR